MLTWMQDYWYLCLIAFLIGVATAAWIWLWADPQADADADGATDFGASHVSHKVETSPAAPKIAAPPVPAAPLEPARPVVPEAKPVAFVAPAAEPAPARVAKGKPKIRAAVGAPDNLQLIKGVGPKLNALLASLGVLRFDQIAAWTSEEIAEVDAHLGNFKGRIERDNWVEQAGMLASGDTAAFEAKYGALGSEIKKG